MNPIHPRPEVCKWHLLQGKGLWELERCAALHYLFCCHPRLEGYPEGFEQELKTLKTGLMRVVQTARADEGEINKDGKKPMSHDLYKCLLARWFFEMGNTDAMFAYCQWAAWWPLGNECVHQRWLEVSMKLQPLKMVCFQPTTAGPMLSGVLPVASLEELNIPTINRPRNN
jgi:hypothetical protein